MLYDLLDEGTRVFYLVLAFLVGDSVHFVLCMHAGGGREQVMGDANAIATWGKTKSRSANEKCFKDEKKKRETMEPRKLAVGYEKLCCFFLLFFSLSYLRVVRGLENEKKCLLLS